MNSILSTFAISATTVYDAAMSLYVGQRWTVMQA